MEIGYKIAGRNTLDLRRESCHHTLDECQFFVMDGFNNSLIAPTPVRIFWVS